MMLGDFHIHSNFSDGKLSIPELVDLYGKAGFGVIAITDHLCEEQTWLGKAARYLNRTLTPGTFPIYAEILKSEAERAWDCYRMIVLPGFELTKNSVSNHRSAHILGIGTTEFIRADQDPVELIKAIHDQGGIAVAAHPVSNGKVEKQTLHLWSRRDELAEHFDAWEVATGGQIFDEVLKSGLPLIANSDLHVRSQFSSWKTLLNCEKHPEAILNAIRNQECRYVYFEEEGSHDYLDWIHVPDLGHIRSAYALGNMLSLETL